MSSFREQREQMVRTHLEARGIKDPRVLAAMMEIPREQFAPDHLRQFAYEDTPLPIEEGQTISQPFMVALMIEALMIGPRERVLEVGAGSGYAACLLSQLAREVFAIERFGSLARLAQERAEVHARGNLHIRHGDGTLGWPEKAPFDAIAVSAGSPDVPRPLLDQLALGGRLVIPVGAVPRTQQLLRIRRHSPTEFQRQALGRVQFVPLIGTQGWTDRRIPAAAQPPDGPPQESPD